MKKVKLGDVVNLNMGQSPESTSYNDEGKGLPFFQGNADFGKINPITRVWCTQAIKIAHKNDMLLSVRAPIGAINIANYECCIGRGLCAITPTSKIDKNYLYYFLISQNTNLNSQGTGSTFKAINKNVLLELEIPLPSLEEQKAIAGKLDKVSGLIEKRKTQLEKLNLLIKSRFIEMFGDPITNSRNLPTERMELRFNLKAGITTSADTIHDFEKGVYEIPCYGGNGIRGYVKEKSYTGHYPIIGRQGALCGNVQYAIGDFHATEHAVLVSLLRDDNAIWVYHLLKLMDLYRYHTGAAQPGLAVKTLNTVEVIVTDKSKQEQFATFVEQVDKSKFEIQKSLEKLEILKKSLMQQYFG
ncbi:MAG: restriction endonuclease subunit S [Clostridia bacterium]|nr:restriction endonuclease subunit S [Clostridia bacterium]